MPRARPIACRARRGQCRAPGHPHHHHQAAAAAIARSCAFATFVRVAGNLSLSVSELSASIPPFNAQKIMAQAEGIAAAADGAAGAEPDAGGVVLHPRSHHRPAEGEDRGRGVRSTKCSPACATPQAGTAARAKGRR